VNIPTEFSWTDLDGAVRTLPLQVNDAGYVSPLTAASMRVLPLEQLRKERDRIAGFTVLSTADWVTLGYLRRQIAVLEAPILELEAELATAIAARDRILEQLQPFTESIDGDGTFAHLYCGRHDQLLRRLEDAEHRVWAAQDALEARSAVASVA